jgi:FADH2-dependent halogenase
MACWLNQLGATGPKERAKYSGQVAVYTHVSGAHLNPDGLLAPDEQCNTVITYAERHHWAWFIPVGVDIVSVGIVVPSATFRAFGESPEKFYERQAHELNPALAARLDGSVIVRPVETCGRFSYRVRNFSGPGWICVGDSHQFIDPIFAFGVHLALFEGRMAAGAIAAYLEHADVAHLSEFERRADASQSVVQDLLDAFWNQPLAFGYLIERKYRDDIIDIFAGRIYDLDEPSPGLQALRDINAAAASGP